MTKHWSSFAELMRGRLPSILKCEVADLPPAFAADKPMVLKIGVLDDLMLLFDGADRDELSQFLRWWTGRREYQEAIVRGGSRHDLFGDVVDQVIDEAQIQHAQRRLGWISKPTPAPSTPSRPVLKLPAVPMISPASTKPSRAIVGRASSSAIKKEAQVTRSIRNAVEASADSAFIQRLLAKARR